MAAVVVCRRLCERHSYFSLVRVSSCLHNDIWSSHMYKRVDNYSSHGKTNGVGGRKANSMMKLRQSVSRFLTGSKQLGYDVLRARKVYKKLKQNDNDYKTLTREEMQHLAKTKKAVAKTFPVVVGFFVLPFVGYTIPIIAYVFPKQLLSHHFWTPQMEAKFKQQDHAKRSNAYLKLAREVGRTSIHDIKDEPSKELLKICEKVVDGDQLSNEELLKIKELFDSESLDFQQLPRYHLTKLSRSWLIRPWLPTGLLRHCVRRRLEHIQRDDAALMREGLHCLSEEEIKHACHSRGLDVSDKDIKELSNWLQEWVELSHNSKGQNTSFLAHSAIFKAAAFTKPESKQQENSKQEPTVPTQSNE